ncbi:hypothetical protein F5Y18DRAFT_315762 [Xylariaceae sp. FL1019]|nr:hypothetical protein F5Y18DRAFT_315762 [Xylariaceae sp. FL1019]
MTTRPPSPKGVTTVVVISIVAGLSTLFALARLWVRVKIMRKFAFDDFLIVVSVISGWLSVAFSAAAVHSGDGWHVELLETKQIEGAILFTLIGFVPGILSFCLPKIAIVQLLSKLLNPSRRHLIWLWFISVFNLVLLLASVGLVFGQCTPSRSQWDFSVPAKYCWNKWDTVHYTQAACAFSAFVDLYLSVYPAIVLYKIRLPTRKKIALSAALGIGSISTVVAVYKITTLDSLASTDFTYDSSNLTIWTIVEGSVIIIAACIPVLQPLLKKVRHVGWISKASSKGTYPSSRDRHEYVDIKKSGDKSRIQKFRRKFEMDSVLDTRNEELVSSHMAAGSQERILEEDSIGMNTVGTGHSKGVEIPPPRDAHHGITRTDHVDISYSNNTTGAAQSHLYQDGWQ